MPKNKYTEKQMKIARVAEPRDEITGADFEKLNNSKAMGGMIKYAEGGDTRREMLMQLREDALEKGDDDAIKEIDAELFQMGDDGGTKKLRYGGKHSRVQRWYVSVSKPIQRSWLWYSCIRQEL